MPKGIKNRVVRTRIGKVIRDVNKVKHQLSKAVIKLPKHLPMLRSPFPSRKFVTFITSVNFDLTATLGGVSANSADAIFRGNGLIGVGQALNYPLGTRSVFPNNYPSGLTYMLGSDTANGSSGIYSKYMVHKSKIRFQIIPKQTAGAVLVFNASPLEVVLTAQQDNGIGYTYTTTQVSEYPLTKRQVIPQQMTTVPKVMEMELTTDRVLGCGALTGKDKQFGGIYNTNPEQSSQWSWFIRVSNLDGTTANYSADLRVTVFHYVELYETNPLLTSAPT